jgi:23S rRNA pseudouridine1911/1915/1917 synthase
MDHSITRRYHAIISGRLMRDEGTVNAPLARSTANRKKMAIVEEGRGKHAITHYKLITPLKNAALIECRLETGRTHQIRVHMSSIGHPLLGDPVYGRISQAHRETLGSLDFSRQALHATVIGFVHPIDRKNLSFESKMPLDMQRLFTKLSA